MTKGPIYGIVFCYKTQGNQYLFMKISTATLQKKMVIMYNYIHSMIDDLPSKRLKKALFSKIYRNLSKSVITIATLIAILVASGTYTVVHAEISNKVDSLKGVYQVEDIAFPEAGTREPRRIVTVISTAYSSDTWQNWGNPCLPYFESFNLCEQFEENGLEDTIATNMLAIGTKVRFPDIYGDKVFTVRDKMNKKYNGQYRVDFYKAELGENGKIDADKSRAEAVTFGAQRLVMEIF